jgi:predicted RecA/RadA family phage recombinase
MAKNYRQPGSVLTMVAPTGGITSGAGYIFGAIFGVAMTDAPEGAPVEVAVEGVWELPKPTAAVSFAAGARVSWDQGARNCVIGGTGTYPIGVAVSAAATTDPVVRVRLNGVATIAA